MTVGILALHGDFAEHRAALLRFDLDSRLVRSAADLAGIRALVLPGGESTTMLKLLHVEGMFLLRGAGFFQCRLAAHEEAHDAARDTAP